MLAQLIEPFTLSFISLGDIITCDIGSSSLSIYDSSSNVFSRKKSKSARSRSRLSSFTDWNPGPSVQSILQQFNMAIGNSNDTSNSVNFSQQTGSSLFQHLEPSNSTNFSSPMSRHCFLFSNYLLLCVRTKDGKLQLLEVSQKTSKEEKRLDAL